MHKINMVLCADKLLVALYACYKLLIKLKTWEMVILVLVVSVVIMIDITEYNKGYKSPWQ